MTAPAIASSPAAASAVALAGTWRLARGQALTLRPATDGILRVAHGRLWATRDGPHGGRPQEAGDHFLEAGRSMLVRAGERVVIEAWTPAAASHFAWEPVLAPVRRPAVARPRIELAALRQPLADLRQAAALALRALAGLGKGLAQVAVQALHGRPRALPGRRPHGALG